MDMNVYEADDALLPHASRALTEASKHVEKHFEN
jgi:hypothetical protein